MKTALNIFLGALFITSCTGNGSGGLFCSNTLPENPEKISIRWSSDGGMLPESDQVNISLDSSYYEKWRDGNHQLISLDINKTEVLELYKVFVEEEFECIKVLEEQEVYDRGGISMDITVDGKYISKSNSGMSFIDDGDVDAYYNVSSAIWVLVNEKLEEEKIECLLLLSDSLSNGIYDVIIRTDVETLYDSKEMGEQDEIIVSLLPGTNLLEVNMNYKDSLNQYDGPVTNKWAQLRPFVSDSTKRIEIKVDEQGIFLND